MRLAVFLYRQSGETARLSGETARQSVQTIWTDSLVSEIMGCKPGNEIRPDLPSRTNGQFRGGLASSCSDKRSQPTPSFRYKPHYSLIFVSCTAHPTDRETDT